MPLELEAANILSSKGFAVQSNYKYDQSDFSVIRDLGVDLHAKTFSSVCDTVTKLGLRNENLGLRNENPGLRNENPGLRNENPGLHNENPGLHNEKNAPGGKKSAQLELLIECRHRHSDAVWVFLPDTNPPELSPVTPGNTIRMVDKFSSYIIASDASALFDAEMPICQKGIEINMEKGDADETVFRQGLSQLQYALPRILTENILFYIETRSEDNIPFLFCPVFLTNSELFVLNRNAGIKEINKASEIGDIAAQVPYLLMYLRYSPDFESQCRNEASRLQDLRRSGNAMIIERRRAAYYESRFNLPFTIIDALMTADRYYLDVFFTQFIVCSSSHFHILADRIRDTAVSAVSSQIKLE